MTTFRKTLSPPAELPPEPALANALVPAPPLKVRLHRTPAKRAKPRQAKALSAALLTGLQRPAVIAVVQMWAGFAVWLLAGTVEDAEDCRGWLLAAGALLVLTARLGR